MDFIARAGYAIDRAHRITGFFLIITLLLCVLVVYQFRNSAHLQNELTEMRNRLPVYVVPGSVAGLYTPAPADMLLTTFTEHVAKALNEYTHANLKKQYLEVQKFFTPKMLVMADAFYKDQIAKVQADERSAVFIIDRTSMKISKVEGEGEMDGQLYDVTFNARRQEILGGTVVESVPLEVKMRIESTFVSKTNPFGYKVARYSEKELKN